MEIYYAWSQYLAAQTITVLKIFHGKAALQKISKLIKCMVFVI